MSDNGDFREEQSDTDDDHEGFAYRNTYDYADDGGYGVPLRNGLRELRRDPGSNSQS
jgi:hypothetical protein